MDIVALGKIVKLHGYKGQFKVATKFDKDFNINNVSKVYDKNQISYDVERVFKVNDGIVFLLKNVDLETAKSLLGQMIFIEREVVSGKILFEDLKGSAVFVEDKNIGTITDVGDYGSAEVIFVKTNFGKELIFPNVQGIIENFDLNSKKLTLNKFKLKEVSDYED